MRQLTSGVKANEQTTKKIICCEWLLWINMSFWLLVIKGTGVWSYLRSCKNLAGISCILNFWCVKSSDDMRKAVILVDSAVFVLLCYLHATQCLDILVFAMEITVLQLVLRAWTSDAYLFTDVTKVTSSDSTISNCWWLINGSSCILNSVGPTTNKSHR